MLLFELKFGVCQNHGKQAARNLALTRDSDVGPDVTHARRTCGQTYGLLVLPAIDFRLNVVLVGRFKKCQTDFCKTIGDARYLYSSAKKILEKTTVETLTFETWHT